MNEAENKLFIKLGKAVWDRFSKELPSKEKRVIELRFRMGEEATYTLEQVGKIFNVTRERIRQLEAKGIERLMEYALKIK